MLMTANHSHIKWVLFGNKEDILKKFKFSHGNQSVQNAKGGYIARKSMLNMYMTFTLIFTNAFVKFKEKNVFESLLTI